MDLSEIQRLLRNGQYEVSFHAQQERLEEDLDLAQIEAAIIEYGEILEESLLIRGEKAAWCSDSSDDDRSTWCWVGPQYKGKLKRCSD